MANSRRENVSYQKLQGKAFLSDGLLGVAREGGDLEQKVAAGFFRLAGIAGDIANDYAAADGARAGRQAALASGPGAASVSGSVDPASAGGPVGGSFNVSEGGKKSPPASAAQIKKRLMERGGLKDHQAAAVIGHLTQESNLRASGAVGDNGTAFGLAQWRNERFASLRQFASGQGADWKNADTQVDFIIHELNTSEKKSGDALRSANNLDDAVAAFMGFERPQGWTPQNPRGGHGWSNRLAYARGAVGGSATSEVDPTATGSISTSSESATQSRSVATPGVVPAKAQINGLVQQGNIDLNSRPVVKNKDGSISTVRSISINEDGVEVLIPTVSPSGTVLTDDGAINLYRSTGKHLGKFKSSKEADVYAKSLHESQERQYLPSANDVEISSGSRGGFRPSNSNSIYGRAYDAEGTKTYLQQLDAAMRSDIFNVYMAAKDDPAALQSKLADLKKLQLEDHVFDEIRPEYDSAFARMTQPYVEQSMRDQQTRVEQRNRAEFLSRTSDLETDVQRQLASIGPDNPHAGAAVEAAQAALDDHFDAAVAHGVLTADDAAKAKITGRRSTAVNFYLKQADNLPADKVAELRKSMQADFAQGGLEGIDGDGWEILDTKLQALERSKQIEDNQAKTALAKRGNDFVTRLAAGFDVDQAELAKFKLDASTAADGQSIVDETMTKIDIAEKFRDMPLSEAITKLQELRKDLGKTPTDAQLRIYGYASDFLEAKSKLVADDPVAYVQNADPEVQAAWAAVTPDSPQSYSKAINLTVAAQERLGVTSPKILPKQLAASAVTQFNNPQLQDDERISAITSLMFATDEPGQRRAIFDQMVGSGLDGFTEGAFNALDRGDSEAARRLFQASMLDPSKLPGTLSEKPAAIDQAIQEEIMSDGGIGDIYYGLSSGTAQNYLQAQRDATLMTRAVQLRLQSGQNLNEAVSGVARDLFGDVVAINRSGPVNAQILLPRDQDPTDVLSGLTQMKGRVREVLESSIITPDGIKSADGGKAIHDAVTRNHINSILNEGVFRSAGENFIFIDSYSGLAVAGKDGKPLVFSLRDVTAAGKDEREKQKDRPYGLLLDSYGFN